MSSAVVSIELVTGPGLPGFLPDATVSATARVETDEAGKWSAELHANEDFLPTGTYYRVTEVLSDGTRKRYTISVPSTACTRSATCSLPPRPRLTRSCPWTAPAALSPPWKA